MSSGGYKHSLGAVCGIVGLVIVGCIIIDVIYFAKSGTKTSEKSALNSKEEKKEEPLEVQRAKSEADAYIKKKFRRYGEDSYYLKWDAKLLLDEDYQRNCEGAIYLEIVKLTWTVQATVEVSDTDERNNIEGRGKIVLAGDDYRRFLVAYSEGDFCWESGRTEYHGGYRYDNFNSPIPMIKKKGEKWKIGNNEKGSASDDWYSIEFATAPSLDEIENCRKLAVSKKIPSWF